MSLLHWVWLGLAITPGSPVIEDILRRYPDPEEFFLGGESAMNEIRSLKDTHRLRLRATTLEMAKNAVSRAESIGAAILSRDDPRFPKRLLSIPDPPVVLYVLGDLSCLDGDKPAIGVVGTRQMSDYGEQMATAIGGGLAAAGALVISGMAKGIDSASQTACIENGGKTVAVQGCGICNVYPPENADLKARIIENGAVISEFAPDAEPQSSFFLIRNRLVSGLSLGVCVIEAASRSGTSVTASLAREQGRDVFAVPADLSRPTAQGTFHLLQNGAIPVSSAADILQRYAENYPELDLSRLKKRSRTLPKAPAKQPAKSVTPKKKAAPAGLSPAAAALYGFIDQEPRSADELSEKAGLSASKAAAALTELEIYSLIKPVSGRRFVAG